MPKEKATDAVDIVDERLLFNQRYTARLIGISARAFSDWKTVQPRDREGRESLYYWPDVQAERDRRLIEKETAPLRARIAELEAQIGADAANEFEDGDGRVLILDEERARLAAEQADKIAMENAVKRGELVYASQMAEIMGKALAAFRARLLAAAVKLAPRVNPGNPNLARELIDAEHAAALAELADFDAGPWMGDGPPNGDGDLLDPPAAAEADGQPVGRRRKKAQ